MWNAKGECCNHVLIRGAVTQNRRMVPPVELLKMVDPDVTSPPLPDWVNNWIEADNTRPWPPSRD